MAAAALGNLVSDIFGVGLGGVVESWAQRLGLPDPGLSRAQMQLPRTRFASHAGCAIGITIGCLIGMFPLLLLPDARRRHSKQRGQLAARIDNLLRAAAAAVGAEAATLLIFDTDSEDAPAGSGDSSDSGGADPASMGIAGRAAASSRPARLLPGSGGDERSPAVLCVPVLGRGGRVIAVLQAVGKRTS
ncbi:unnamed protein product, partial [Phaeothamnion confervicola]